MIFSCQLDTSTPGSASWLSADAFPDLDGFFGFTDSAAFAGAVEGESFFVSDSALLSPVEGAYLIAMTFAFRPSEGLFGA